MLRLITKKIFNLTTSFFVSLKEKDIREASEIVAERVPNDTDNTKTEEYLRNIYKKLKRGKALGSCLGRHDLLKIMHEGIDHFREHYKGKVVLGWKNTVHLPNGINYVPFIAEDDDRIIIRFHKF